MPKEENQADKQSLEAEPRQLVDIIIGQTEYSREQAIEGLERLKGDYMAVIREYLGTSKKESKPKSLNQQIYSEIRNHLY